MTASRIYELIGVGIGVFNLSVAALLDDCGFDDALFFDAKPQMAWHGGMLLESSELQVHFLKDLVTPVDPTSRYTFLNYLKQRGVLYQFINRKTSSVSRNQYDHYFRWVAGQLPTIRFASRVESIRFDGELFHLVVNGEPYRARHIAVATGLQRMVPDCAQPHLGDTVFHVQDYVQRRSHLEGARIAVVGGGQSGAEVVMDIMESVPHRELGWYGRRVSFSQLEDNCFINDMYVPSFTYVFRDAPMERRRELIDKLAMSSDGINQSLLDSIYRLAFERSYFADEPRRYDFRSGQELVDLQRGADGLTLHLKSWIDGREWSVQADAVVLATGFRSSTRDTLRDVLGEPGQGDIRIGSNFEVQWPHQDRNHIFLQNGSRMCIGLADPNLSIAAWRAAMIVNRVVGNDVYSINPDRPLVKFC